MIKVTIFVFLAILGLIPAVRSCTTSDNLNKNRKPREKSDDARNVTPNTSTSKVDEPEQTEGLNMNDPERYHLSNQNQRRDARETLSKCPMVNDWHSGSLLDIGCGAGDVTKDIIRNVLPKHFERLVGIDMSEEMVQFARKNHLDAGISFEQLDIGLELEEKKLCEMGKFDHITSFNCLHWVTKNQNTSVENMYKLLKPGGDMLLIFVAKHPIYGVFKKLSEMEKWAGFMSDVEDIFSPYYHSKDPARDYEQLLKSKGFSETYVTNRKMPYTFQTIDSLRNTFAAVNPFLKRIPEDKHEDHLNDMVKLIKEGNSEHNVRDSFLIHYISIVAYAKKENAPSTSNTHSKRSENVHLQRFKMYDPKLYHSSNRIQRRDARETLSKCPMVSNWHSGSLLDIGCGSGDVTVDIIKNVLPKHFERLVGIDSSEEMVQFARENYLDAGISFKQLDISLELEKQKLCEMGKFAHITSLNCLHWVTKNQNTSVENMYKFLKPGGDMLSLLVVEHPIYEVFKELSKMEKWIGFMSDVEDIFSPYYHSKDPARDYEQLLKSKGFSITNVTIREMSYTFVTVDSLRNTFAAVNPFLKRIPEDKHEDHLNDMVKLFIGRHSQLIFGVGFPISYKAIVAYAKKEDALSTSNSHALP